MHEDTDSPVKKEDKNDPLIQTNLQFDLVHHSYFLL